MEKIIIKQNKKTKQSIQLDVNITQMLEFVGK